MSLRTKEVENEPHDKNDMQAWIAEVLMKGLCWVSEVKWGKSTHIQELWMFRNCGRKVCATFRGGGLWYELRKIERQERNSER
jgi:hypothetical protein